LICQEESLSPSRIAAVVLAAGMSRRMGRPKALLPLGGQTLIARVVETIRASGVVGTIVVVTGHQEEQIEHELPDCNVQFVHNSDYADGEMLSSVKVAVRAIANQCDAFFLVLADQPLVNASTYQMLARHDGLIVQPTFDGKRGHPILIRANAIDEILSLPRDATLKTFTSTHRDQTKEIPVDDPGILTDIDTPTDYDRAVQIVSAHRSSSCSKPQETVLTEA
jgi:molybdenum cofactor cytidylyltransferase